MHLLIVLHVVGDISFVNNANAIPMCLGLIKRGLYIKFVLIPIEIIFPHNACQAVHSIIIIV